MIRRLLPLGVFSHMLVSGEHIPATWVGILHHSLIMLFKAACTHMLCRSSVRVNQLISQRKCVPAVCSLPTTITLMPAAVHQHGWCVLWVPWCMVRQCCLPNLRAHNFHLTMLDLPLSIHVTKCCTPPTLLWHSNGRFAILTVFVHCIFTCCVQ